EDARPFTEGEVRGDDNRGALVEPADEVKQELPAGLREGQIAEFVEDDEVHARQMIGEPSLPTVAGFGLEPVDEIDHVIKPAADAGSGCSFWRWRWQDGFCRCRTRQRHNAGYQTSENR